MLPEISYHTSDAVHGVGGGCVGVGDWQSEASWFPGFVWRVCVCPQCGHHLGWIFEPEDLVSPGQDRASSTGFYGLILASVIDESFAESLTISKPRV